MPLDRFTVHRSGGPFPRNSPAIDRSYIGGGGAAPPVLLIKSEDHPCLV
jgi:hypothetical protein